jgi:methyltransferase family protein
MQGHTTNGWILLALLTQCCVKLSRSVCTKRGGQAAMVLNAYQDTSEIQRAVNEGRHREVIGGLWDEIGRLQFEYMVKHGLERRSRLIDVGCGSLRGGVHFVAYLDEGRYFGLDSNLSLLDAGYDLELKALHLRDKLPRQNLICDDVFDFDLFDSEFDFAIAQSLFTHLPVNHIRLCLTRLARKMRAGGRFFATFFVVEDSHPYGEPSAHAGGITTFDAKDPFHYRSSDLPYFCKNLPWRPEFRGGWNHPRDQQMVEFVRL